MFGRRIPLFRVSGIQIGIDPSWFIIAVLVAWSLAGMFHASAPDASPRVYWTMGIVGALGLFVSIVLHELGHATVAQRLGIRIRGITLFLFGGVAEMTDEPPSPAAEFKMAIAGPAVSVFIALVCGLMAWVGRQAAWSFGAVGVLSYLAWINGILVLFNMIPGFPLDGGRVLRSALWKWKNDLRWASRITSEIGSGFGIFLILLGVVSVLGGNWVGGMWWFLIGMFLRNAAQQSYRQVLVRQSLQGEPIRRFMQPDVRTVPPQASISELVDDFVYRYHFKMFPVVDNGRLVGCVTLQQIRSVPREDWDAHTVGDIMSACHAANTIHPDADALVALTRMNRTGASRLMVVDGDRLVGIVAMRDLMSFLTLKLELESPEPPIDNTADPQARRLRAMEEEPEEAILSRR